MVITAATVAGVLVVALLALGPILLPALPDRAQHDPELAAAWGGGAPSVSRGHPRHPALAC